MDIPKFELKAGILVYEALDSSAGHQYYLQRHRVGIKENIPFLLEGKPISTQALRLLCEAVLPGLKTELTFIQPNILASSGRKEGPVVWWCPPAIRSLFFTENLRIKNGQAPIPGLVMVADKNGLNIWAVATNDRPFPDTELFMAPFFNMTAASICMGSAEKPKDIYDTSGWEKSFFGSAFSEDRNQERIKGMPLRNLWRGLIARKVKAFPTDKLLPANLSVGKLIKQLDR